MLKALKATAVALAVAGTVGFVAAPALAKGKAAAPKTAATTTMHKAVKPAKKMASMKAMHPMAKKTAAKKK
ncbi:MAG: hypothetical protein KGO02_20035 [Alphaproteobacteria bacterium]|nr:hypothetical protein [Alphaproteobacteria bacterium]